MRGDDLSEHAIQVQLVQEMRLRLKREVVAYAVPNGGLRNLRVAQKLKAEGLLPGMTDLGFALPDARSAYLEMKNARGSLSIEQKGIRYKLEQLGHQWAMARSVEEAMEHLHKWGALR